MTITIKKFDFDMEPHLSTDYARNKILTRILNSFSLLLPVGERYFIESIRAYRDDVSDEMKEQINLFIRQEAQHGKEHRKLNSYLNIDQEKVDKEALALLQKHGKDKAHALLTTVTLERLTGLMGIILPKTKSHLFPKRSEIAHMWIVHGKEELEHVPVGERLMKEECNFGVIKQAHYMSLAIKDLSKIVWKNYWELKRNGS